MEASAINPLRLFYKKIGAKSMQRIDKVDKLDSQKAKQIYQIKAELRKRQYELYQYRVYLIRCIIAFCLVAFFSQIPLFSVMTERFFLSKFQYFFTGLHLAFILSEFFCNSFFAVLLVLLLLFICGIYFVFAIRTRREELKINIDDFSASSEKLKEQLSLSPSEMQLFDISQQDLIRYAKLHPIVQTQEAPKPQQPLLQQSQPQTPLIQSPQPVLLKETPKHAYEFSRPESYQSPFLSPSTQPKPSPSISSRTVAFMHPSLGLWIFYY